jgi:hypothetical protein
MDYRRVGQVIAGLLLALAAGCGWYLRDTGHGNPIEWYRHEKREPATRPAPYGGEKHTLSFPLPQHVKSKVHGGEHVF